MSEKLKQHKASEESSGDQYPWLDEDDLRRTMTDEQILHLKVPLDKIVLMAAEKEHLN